MKLRILYRLIQLIGKETIIDEMIPEDMYESLSSNLDENVTLISSAIYDSVDFIRHVREYKIDSINIILEKYECKKHFLFKLPEAEWEEECNKNYENN